VVWLCEAPWRSIIYQAKHRTLRAHAFARRAVCAPIWLAENSKGDMPPREEASLLHDLKPGADTFQGRTFKDVLLHHIQPLPLSSTFKVETQCALSEPQQRPLVVLVTGRSPTSPGPASSTVLKVMSLCIEACKMKCERSFERLHRGFGDRKEHLPLCSREKMEGCCRSTQNDHVA
jgi:hypothetical protein